ncbi:MAG: type II toxin-antitoxin system RelE/ParE family toxin [Candidatus Promineofilum sp.]|jgi:mRNA interferase RelE/StbE|nr:type II toxin-antitoxin system RelE/ParE family toxin [Promineifilum sp.]
MDTEPIPYRVELSETAVKNLRRFPHNDQRRILAQIEQLAANPQEMQGVKRLVGYDVTYRLRVGDYRVLFDRDDVIRIIDVVNVLPRGRAYRRK